MGLNHIVRQTMSQNIRTLLTTTILLTVCFFALLFLSQPDLRNPTCGFQTTTRSFLQREDLEDLTPAGDEAWRNLTTANGGSLWVRTTDINEVDDKIGMEEWGITMFHALHCLQMIRSALAVPEPGIANDHTAHQQSDHIAHCLVYLAEVVMCQADSTLEPPTKTKLPSGKVRTAVDGVGYLHQCQDTSLLWEAAEASQKVPREPWSWWPGQKLQDLIDMQGL